MGWVGGERLKLYFMKNHEPCSDFESRAYAEIATKRPRNHREHP